jgi:antitoxin component YwqK of YwqJK toxin-antitoxin module
VDVVKIAEGMYLDNKKEGLWKSFFPDGKIKHSVIYKNDLALKK